MKSKQLILGHFLTLFIGSIIYILFRTKTLKMFSWFSAIKINKEINFIRNKVQDIHPADWIKYSLPDGLWIFSFISLMLFIWKNHLTKDNILWILSIPTIAILSEILQAFNLKQGTFDNMDLLMYSLGTILPFIFYQKSIIINLKQV